MATTQVGNARSGITVNSFSSISLNPPLVAFSVAKNAGSFDAFQLCDEVGINVLASTQEAIARQFAKSRPDKFAGIALEQNDHRSPIIQGATSWMICDIHKRIDLGDHIMLVGEVTDCAFTDEPPLAYWNGNIFDMGAENALEVIRVSGRTIYASWVVEHQGKIALSKVRGTGDARSLPSSKIGTGALSTTIIMEAGREVFGADIEAALLYSAFSLSGSDTYVVHRGIVETFKPAERPELDFFAEEEIPWDKIHEQAERKILRRYLEEKSEDRFGVYMSVGMSGGFVGEAPANRGGSTDRSGGSE